MSLKLNHLTRPSSLESNAPLLIMCHGYGSDENDLFSFASELPEELFIISVKAAYQLQPYGNAWYAIHFDAEQGKWSDNEQAIISRDLLADFIDYACDAYPKCRYIVNHTPVKQDCAECQWPMMGEKKVSGKQILECPQRRCGHRLNISQNDS